MAPKTIAFSNHGNEFFAELRRRVDGYFQSKSMSKNGNYKLWWKTAFALLFTPALLVLAYWGNLPFWAVVIVFALVGVMHAFTGFNVMHDACHGSFSSKPWVNKLFSHSLEMLGSHAPIWKFKHNVLHHTWTNIDGLDDDIAKSPFLRHCESQALKPMHKFQHVYMFGLYAISTIWWLFGNDTIKYFKREVNLQPLPKFTVYEHFTFWVSKIIYLLIYLVYPATLFGWGSAFLLFFVLHASLGILLSLVFQMAHAVDGIHFENVEVYDRPVEKIPNEWAIHQIMTTSNFATRSWLATWFMGGLNFQVEHHLFPNISHVHYPEVNKILKGLCNEFNVKYNEVPTFWQSIQSHIRWMRKMGQPELAVAA